MDRFFLETAPPRGVVVVLNDTDVVLEIDALVVCHGSRNPLNGGGVAVVVAREDTATTKKTMACRLEFIMVHQFKFKFKLIVVVDIGVQEEIEIVKTFI